MSKLLETLDSMIDDYITNRFTEKLTLLRLTILKDKPNEVINTKLEECKYSKVIPTDEGMLKILPMSSIKTYQTKKEDIDPNLKPLNEEKNLNQ